MDDRGFEFVPAVFFKVLAVTLTIVVTGWLGSIGFYGVLAFRDIVGSLICAPIFAYLVHLWIVYSKQQDPHDRT